MVKTLMNLEVTNKVYYWSVRFDNDKIGIIYYTEVNSNWQQLTTSSGISAFKTVY